MTVIVGLVSDGRVTLGGDSAGVEGWEVVVRQDAKVFRRGPFVMGFTTSFRMGQLLRYSLEVPERGDQDVEAFLATRFVDAVRACLKAGGFAGRENEVEQGGRFLVGYQGALFMIDSDYQVARPRAPYAAVGSGAAYALGSLHTNLWVDVSPRRKLRRALDAAHAYNIAVRPPFRFVSGGDR